MQSNLGTPLWQSDYNLVSNPNPACVAPVGGIEACDTATSKELAGEHRLY